MDRDKVWAFIERFTELAAGATTIGLLSIADRAGLLRSMTGEGPLTAAEAASRAGLQPRYVEEILAGLAAAGVVEYDPDRAAFTLPDEHATCFDDESPYSMAGWLDMLPAVLREVPEITRATREGGGVPLEAFDDDVVRGIDRANRPSMSILLTRRWLPTMPDVVSKLEAGARVADVGCGSGGAAIAMATAYPRSEVIGYDIDPRALERAREAARGIDNVAFERAAAEDLPTEPGFDLVTTFDVVHDLARPLEALGRIRRALRAGGTYLLMEPAMEPDLEDNLHARGALVYGISVLHCLTQSLAREGAGLGAAWGPRKAEGLCREAGFTGFRRLPIDNPFSAFYEVRA